MLGCDMAVGSAQWMVGSIGKNVGSVMLFIQVTLLGMPTVAKKVAEGEFVKGAATGVVAVAS